MSKERLSLLNATREAKKVQQRQYLFEKFNGRCCYCDEQMQIDWFHIEHLVPKCKGGSNEERNLLIACPTCNLIKKTQEFETYEDAREYIRSKRGMSSVQEDVLTTKALAEVVQSVVSTQDVAREAAYEQGKKLVQSLFR